MLRTEDLHEQILLTVMSTVPGVIHWLLSTLLLSGTLRRLFHVCDVLAANN